MGAFSGFGRPFGALSKSRLLSSSSMFGTSPTFRGALVPGSVGLGRFAPRAPLPRFSPTIPRYPGLPTNIIRIGRLTYVPDPLGLRTFVRSTGMQRVLGAKAASIRDTAKALAPVDTGEYRDSIESTEGISEDAGTAMGRVYATARHAGYVEFGTSDTPIHAPLRRAAESESS